MLKKGEFAHTYTWTHRYWCSSLFNIVVFCGEFSSMLPFPMCFFGNWQFMKNGFWLWFFFWELRKKERCVCIWDNQSFNIGRQPSYPQLTRWNVHLGKKATIFACMRWHMHTRYAFMRPYIHTCAHTCMYLGMRAKASVSSNTCSHIDLWTSVSKCWSSFDRESDDFCLRMPKRRWVLAIFPSFISLAIGDYTLHLPYL